MSFIFSRRVHSYSMEALLSAGSGCDGMNLLGNMMSLPDSRDFLPKTIWNGDISGW